MARFQQSVFVNCPLDTAYAPLLRALLFTVVYLGLRPRIALESSDSGEPRIQKIIRLIQESRFSIHDLSRCQARKKGEMFRLNMPLELGLDIGCRVFARGKSATKRCLILETRRYRFQKAISDLSNSDIAAHHDSPDVLVRVVRDWLVQEAGAMPKSASAIWGRYLDFTADDFERLQAAGYTKGDIIGLPIIEVLAAMKRWTGRQSNAQIAH